ncbi:MAG TPA: hypothetical protein VL307_07020 [Chitinophagaceae bacterium]|nr:hypothetical protein [Chitinophagaceae bacterium]
MSMAFADCANQQLSLAFARDAGIKLSKLISISWAGGPDFFYEKGNVSKFASDIWINHHHNPINIAWQSTSGRIYDIADTDIDCNDIQFWFEGFDALLYHRQMFPTVKLPFRLKDLSYELQVLRLNMDCSIEMTIKETDLHRADELTNSIDDFIDNYNKASEKKDRSFGVVHNWRSTAVDNKLMYEIDTGFTGARFLKKLLLFLSSLSAFEKVEVK